MSSSHARLVCRCLGVTNARIEAAVEAESLATVAEVTKATRAGGGCTLCHPEIDEILRAARGAPIDPALALENARVCHEETLARVRGVLLRVAPAHGARVAHVAVDGLEVRVHCAGAADRRTVDALAKALLRDVCEDLDVAVTCDREAGPDALG
jgi:NAD(P)H-nitrite reductase large subunit